MLLSDGREGARQGFLYLALLIDCLFQHVADLVQEVIDAIPTDWRISKEDLAAYPAGSDVRPLAKKCGILTSRELDITDTSKDATSLLEELASGSISAVEAVTAFSKRAAVAHQAVTCLAGFYYQDARKRAVELDAILKATGKPVGPLHGTSRFVSVQAPSTHYYPFPRVRAGLPISVKVS